MSRIVVFAPHPDDETLGCGGSIAQHTAAGRRVSLVFLTSGEQGVDGVLAGEAGRLREREAEGAAGKLRVPARDLHFLHLPDGGLDPGSEDQFLAVLRLLRHLRPAVVYLPHAADASHDHQQAFRLVWRALEKGASRSYPAAGARHWVGTVLGYEVWSPLAAPSYLHTLDPPDVAAKEAALACYVTQVKGQGEADYASGGGLALARFRGAMTSGGHREAFAALRVACLHWQPGCLHSP
ncbi:PIG-L deacetylase family protein [Streptomyces sp. MMBL 11-3]|uniref:PIG-L deacetylase family protein n=1 Tax=Streptomyces sp. MMBL 11-3 TaxID=3382639 RepID=UPI0039B48F97